jgi:hypothetical protein
MPTSLPALPTPRHDQDATARGHCRSGKPNAGAVRSQRLSDSVVRVQCERSADYAGTLARRDRNTGSRLLCAEPTADANAVAVVNEPHKIFGFGHSAPSSATAVRRDFSSVSRKKFARVFPIADAAFKRWPCGCLCWKRIVLRPFMAARTGGFRHVNLRSHYTRALRCI